ncbi:hypothetical protein B0T11DRAFT_116473 [Plectosphaerella cucumerina]|uniref:Zn(2)-C6 fungal-type domain-containing protein n=1 Tax=Plectosphaerella cucumerina TaxID=40658 RepID=A0A8K0TD58_9PEZI|nr:hypothetical protein B0T11DRAFT_116473 [Plectosphaerella cucumerina]
MTSRSKSGCITCRIRRVKCDETRPACQKCQSSKRTCDGYLSDENAMSRRKLAEAVRHLSVVGPVSHALTKSPSSSNPLSRPISPNDTTFFDLFRRATIPGTCNIFPSSIWDQNVMQLSHGETAIWHAAVALGALHQRESVGLGGPEDSQLARRAEAHYCRAMALASELDSSTKVVTLSILLISAASMLARFSDMQTHIISSLRIITQDAARTPGLDALRGSLMRIDVQAMTFSDSSSPYPYDKSADVSTVDTLLNTPFPRDLSYDTLSSEMFAIARGFFLLDDTLLAGTVPHGPWLTKLDALIRRLVVWENRVAAWEIGHQPTHSQMTTKICIRLFHVTMRTVIHATSFGPESRYDPYLGNFEYSVFEYSVRLAATLVDRIRGGSSMSLSLEPGLIIPLWMVVHRCRHWGLRRAALDILATAKRVEGMWRSDATGKILAAVVAVEEESLPQPVVGTPYKPPLLGISSLTIPWSAWAKPGFIVPSSLSWDDGPVVPDKKRVKEILGMARLSDRLVDLSLMMSAENDEDPYGPMRPVRVTL